MVTILKPPSDEYVTRIASALEEFEADHPDAECIVYRYNPAAIRVRIVDSVFGGMSKGDRHDYALQYLRRLPEDTREELSLLLCLAPGERSMMDMAFETPTPSEL